MCEMTSHYQYPKLANFVNWKQLMLNVGWGGRCGSFKHSVGTERIDKQTIWKCIWHCYQDKTKVKVLVQLLGQNQSLLLHCDTISQMLLCTMVLHLALVSALLVMTAILLQWCHAKILLHLVPYPNDSITNGNRPQNIVSHLVLDQSDSVVIGAGPNHSVTFSAVQYIW